MLRFQDTGWQAYGEALMSNGLYTRSGISGIGLITRGFVYGVYDIYLDIEKSAPITTSWVIGSSVALTSWSVGSSVAATSWNEEQQGYFGDSIP